MAKANPNLVVVLQSGGPVALPWADDVPAILCAWYAGQATGDAIADVLTGKVSPSGKLCCTFGKRLEDYPPHALKVWPPTLRLDQHPKNAPNDIAKRKPIHGYDADYKEGVFIGYRWFESKDIASLFPFGHGLSYSSFTVEDAGITLKNSTVEAPSATLRVKLTNTGKREASEVIQVYVGDDKATVPRPPRELKAFQKVSLAPGESRTVELSLGTRAFAFWGKDGWTVEPGTFTIAIGSSSRDIRFTKSIALTQKK